MDKVMNLKDIHLVRKLTSSKHQGLTLHSYPRLNYDSIAAITVGVSNYNKVCPYYGYSTLTSTQSTKYNRKSQCSLLHCI